MPIVIIVMFLISIGYVSAQLYLPSLPYITQDLNTINTFSKLTVTAYFVGLIFTQLIAGPLSDAVGRKKPLIIGITIGMIGAIFCSMAQSIHMLIISRLVQGAGTGVALAIARPILRDTYSGDELAKRTAQASGIAIGAMSFSPIIGGYLQFYFGWRAAFYAITIYLFCSLMVILFLLPETKKNPNGDRLHWSIIKNDVKSLLTHRHFLFGLSGHVAFFSSIVAWQTGGSIILQYGLGISPIQFGWITVFVSLSFMVGSLINSRVIEHFSQTKLIQMGSIVAVACGFWLMTIGILNQISVIAVAAAMMLYTFSAGFIISNALAIAFEDFVHISGIANSVYTFVQILGSALASVFISYTADVSTIPLGFVLLLGPAVTLAIKPLLIKEN